MKVSLSALAAAVLAGALGCSSSGPASPPAKTAADAKAEKAAEDAKRSDRAKALLGLQAPAEVPGEAGEAETSTIVDPETGRKLLRIRKQILYYEKDGRLFNAVVVGPGLPIVRTDEKAYYVLAPPDAPKPGPKETEAPPGDLQPIVELPASEAAVVTPKIRKGTFRFEEISEGLPRAGMWRENFDVGDVLGQGRPQIVAPPARLTGNFIRVYRLDKDADDNKWRWHLADVKFENPDKIDAAYGAATLADMDGDGKLDIVFGGHGMGPAIAFNKGGGAFKVETRGLPRQMSTRAIAAGDLNGDGRQDLLVISDDPEWMLTGGHPNADAGSDYVKGYDVRGFLNEGSYFREVHKGLEGACFGYSIALVVPRDGKDGLPFYSSACRYTSGAAHLFEFDPKLEEFRFMGVAGALETWAQHMGSAAGTYRGRPAAFATWFKRTPSGAVKKIDGQGITVYYRDADGKMAGKRVVKTLQFDAGSPAIAVGDLDGDGLDDVVWCDESTQRMRVFFQTPEGEFEELPPDREPTFVNHPTSLRIADFDGDGRKDVALMYQYLTGDETRAGGLRVFRGLSQ